MKKAILLILAAGMGSRYGGSKQIDSMGPHGEIIMEYSVYDAIRTGFSKVVFLIKKEMQDVFEEKIVAGLRKKVDTAYAFQSVSMIPDGFSVPDGRRKPWGTAHAVLCAAAELDAPFAVINADDYYGAEAFRNMYRFLTEEQVGKNMSMIGYRLKNTVSDFGSVSRGLCAANEQGELLRVEEYTCIEKQKDGRIFDTSVQPPHELDGDQLVSMNFWGFPPSFTEDIREALPSFLQRALRENPLKAELYLPDVVTKLLRSGEAGVKVLSSSDRWFGVTNPEDKPNVCANFARLHAEGIYPDSLWN